MPPEDLMQMCDDRIQRALLMIWRGPPFKPRMRLVRDVLLDRLDQTRLADPRLATQEHHLSLPVFDLEPPFEQELHLLFAAHERREASADSHVEATLGFTSVQDAKHPRRRRDALERMQAEVLTGEPSLHEVVRGGTDHHRIVVGEGLQSCCYIRRFPEREPFGPTAIAHRTDDDIASVNSDAGGKTDPALLRQALAQPADGLHHSEGGVDRPLAIVFVRVGKAKIDEQSVAQILRDIPFEELDDLSAGRLVGPHHVAQVFGVQVYSERRGIDQVAKHDRELTAFGHLSRAFSERDGCLMRPGESPIMPLLGRGRAGAAHLYRERSATSPAELEERWIREPAVQTALLERDGTRAAELHFLRVVRAAAWTAHARIPLGDDLRSGILAGHRSMVKHARVGLSPPAHRTEQPLREGWRRAERRYSDEHPGPAHRGVQVPRRRGRRFSSSGRRTSPRCRR